MKYIVTGHRPDKLGGYSPKAHFQRYMFAVQMLKEHKVSGCSIGMALGWDTAVALACVELKVPFMAYLPFDGQEAVWKTCDQSLYRDLLSKAASKVYINPPPYEAWKMLARNRVMVDANPGQSVLALWDGSLGGTAHCVRYAQGRFHIIVNCWTKWKELHG